jgi:hypothetical protein
MPGRPRQALGPGRRSRALPTPPPATPAPDAQGHPARPGRRRGCLRRARPPPRPPRRARPPTRPPPPAPAAAALGPRRALPTPPAPAPIVAADAPAVAAPRLGPARRRPLRRHRPRRGRPRPKPPTRTRYDRQVSCLYFFIFLFNVLTSES